MNCLGTNGLFQFLDMIALPLQFSLTLRAHGVSGVSGVLVGIRVGVDIDHEGRRAVCVS